MLFNNTLPKSTFIFELSALTTQSQISHLFGHVDNKVLTHLMWFNQRSAETYEGKHVRARILT